MQKSKSKASKTHLVTQVIRGAREYSIGTVLFHQAVGQRLGINVTDMKCLDVMILRGSMTPTELAQHTGLSSGATTAMIDRLETAGLIERHPHPSDRRATNLSLANVARRKLPQLFQSLADAMEALAAGYSEGELAVVADFFDKAAVVWEKERQKIRSRPSRGLRGAARKTIL